MGCVCLWPFLRTSCHHLHVCLVRPLPSFCKPTRSVCSYVSTVSRTFCRSFSVSLCLTLTISVYLSLSLPLSLSNYRLSYYSICGSVDCGRPNTHTGAMAPACGSGTTVGQTCMFTCLPGYPLTGTGTLPCCANGVWGTPDSCIVLVCVCVHVPRAPHCTASQAGPTTSSLHLYGLAG